MNEFLMPKLGADMTSGRLVAWHAKPGDRVARGEIVAEVDTDKGVIDVEIFQPGVIQRLVVSPGEMVAVGAVLALITYDASETAATTQPPVAAAPAESLPTPTIEYVQPVEATATTSVHRVAASPSARRLAHELGIDLSTVKGSGPGGAVTRDDVQRANAEPYAATASPPTSPPPSTRGDSVDRAARRRRSIAAAMSRSKREIPHYYLSTTVDLHRALAWLAQENERRGTVDRLLTGVLLIKAVALAVRELPEFNSIWDGDQVVPRPNIHIGVAISLREGGLIAPAIHDVDQQPLGALMQQLRDLVQRARSGALRSSELSDPTITVTNLGEQGVESVFGVIYPPQVAIIGFGKIVERPWVVDGQIVPRPILTVSLAADHRVSDGHRGALLLSAIERLLQEPEKL